MLPYTRTVALFAQADLDTMVKKPLTKIGMVTRQQVRAARAWLNWSQDTLAEESGVARRAIQDFESGKRVMHERTLRDLQQTLERIGIEFIFNGERAVGIHFRDPE
jgi:DNA-binding XRE family transcriptional regulator